MRAGRRAWPIIVVALLAAGQVGVGLAQEGRPAGGGKKILEIRVVGNHQISTQEILGQVQSRVGEVYSRELAQEDQRRLMDRGQFEQVVPQVEEGDGGVVLIFQVIEWQRIKDVQIDGARAIKPADIREQSHLLAGNFLAPDKLAAARTNITDYYHSKGYYFAEVTLDPVALKEGRVRIVIREGPHVRIDHIQYRGNDTLSDSDLGKQIDSKAYMWIFAAGELNERTLKNDVVRLIQYYRDQGFLDVSEKTLSYQLQFSPDQTKVTVVFLVHEGARYKVGSIKFEGNTVFPAKDLRGLMLLQPGQFFTADDEKHDVKAISDQLYGREGYVNTKVDILPRFADEPGVVNLTVRLIEAERIFVGRILIRGNDVTHDNVILREVTMQPTDPYNVVEAEETRRKLMNTRLFGDKIEIAPAPTGPGNQRDVIVTVEESRTTSFMIGAGISSDAGLLGNITIENRNFDLFGWPKTFGQMFTNQAFKGAGETLRVVAEPGTGMNRFQIQYFDPYLMDQNLSLGSNLYYFEAPRYGLKDSSTVSYRESHIGYMLSLGERFRQNWSLEEAVRVEGVDISSVDPAAAQEIQDASGMHLLVGGKFTLAHDTTDNRFSPSAGDRFYVSAEPITGSDTFAKLTTGYTAYQTLRTDVYDRKTILSERVTAGYIPGSAPFFERFYAGGIDSMRGFAFRSVSPREGALEDPIGGNFEFLASTEYIFPLIAKSQGVFFVDTGTVEATPGFSAYRAAVGFEVRIPIDFFGSVPLTLGVGVPVLKQSGDKAQYFHFMFGASF